MRTVTGYSAEISLTAEIGHTERPGSILMDVDSCIRVEAFGDTTIVHLVQHFLGLLVPRSTMSWEALQR